MTRIALCFPGQGSQAPGMADELLDRPAGVELLAEAARLGLDLRQALAGDAGELRATEIAQPALVFVELVLAADLPPGLDLVGVAGHSVGEYAAGAVAGALSPPEAMRLVIERGRAMAAMHQGTMVALLGIDARVAEEICAAVSLAGEGIVVVANYNAPGQVVLSGSTEAVDAAVSAARERGLRRAVPLNVSGAFHSPLMAVAARRLSAALDQVSWRTPSVPVISNVDAVAVADSEGLRERWGRQISSPVQWTGCVERLGDLGAEVLVELGPGTVLTGLARRIAPRLRAISVSSPAAAAGLGASLAATTPVGP